MIFNSIFQFEQWTRETHHTDLPSSRCHHNLHRHRTHNTVQYYDTINLHGITTLTMTVVWIWGQLNPELPHTLQAINNKLECSSIFPRFYGHKNDSTAQAAAEELHDTTFKWKILLDYYHIREAFKKNILILTFVKSKCGGGSGASFVNKKTIAKIP